MYIFLVFAILFSNTVFAQFSEKNPYFEPYIGDEKVGLRINPVLTGLKSSKLNQEMDLNITLFYQNKYLLSNQEILGYINGRLISEQALSSYDPLEEIKKRDKITISNYGEKFPEYQKALKDFKKFQSAFQTTVDQLNEKMTSEEATNAEEYYYEESVGEDTNTASPVEDTENTDDIAPDVVNYPTEDELEAYHKKSLNYQNPKVFAQNMDDYTGLAKFPQLNYDGNRKNLSSAELKFLIQYEILKRNYNEAIKVYNEALSNDMHQYKSSFDPADPAEEFTIMLLGDTNKKLWIKKFHLDGKKTYQSHNDSVWYLQYQLPLTRKDVRALYQVFQNNDTISYYIKGYKGTINFALDRGFIKAVRALLLLYAQGGLIINPDTEFPIMRNQ